jgi:hypothetical protein
VPTEEELRREVLVVPRRAYFELPGQHVVDREDFIQIVTPSLRSGGLNVVTHAAIGEDDVEATIDQVLATFREAQVRWRWIVGPDSTPADLGERLTRRGMVRSEVSGLARATSAVPSAPGVGASPPPFISGPGVTVERVDDRTVDEFTEVMGRGWGIDPAPLAPIHAAMVARPEDGHHLYLARIDGRAVGAAKAVLFARSVYLQAGVVLAAERHRGAYRALIAARVEAGAAAGLPIATSHARPQTSEAILVGMGFRVIERFASYAFPA